MVLEIEDLVFLKIHLAAAEIWLKCPPTKPAVTLQPSAGTNIARNPVKDGTLTRVDICSRLNNQQAHANRSLTSSTPNDVAPTNSNDIVSNPIPNHAKATTECNPCYQISPKRRRLGISRYQNTLRLDFTKSTRSHREPLIRIVSKPLLLIRTQILRLSSIYAAVWSKVGGAEFVSSRSFDWYHFGALVRRVEGA
ncbi:hypothetical protein F511_16504 [Dorcoceras hygrometricum]|uniref:Uncharacterized protein n=1 Tax=Dorcoceras hygrometricum TaxID=472368 RepID=A0A2Z7BRG7_9LAMI|nr:hypothetical protein F511_16504 [Dorcoceras hygrometricum]